VAFTSEVLVASIDGLTSKYPALSREFVGLVLLPIMGNAAEHWTAVSSASHNRLSLALSVAVGSSLQIALFGVCARLHYLAHTHPVAVIPFVVTLGWMLFKPLTLFFDPLESAALFMAVLTVNYATQDGRANWLEGVVLIVVYILIATCIFFYPGKLA
jgi:Ca2+:H+ antiporter